jgi:hypothetical protein
MERYRTGGQAPIEPDVARQRERKGTSKTDKNAGRMEETGWNVTEQDRFVKSRKGTVGAIHDNG